MNRSYFEEVLNEDYDMVPPDIIAVIAALPRLRHLEIASLELGDEGLKGLTGLENNWTTLNLNCCDISAEGMKVFCESDGIKTLTTLDIGSNNLGEARFPKRALRSRFGEGVKFKFPWTQGRLDLRRE